MNDVSDDSHVDWSSFESIYSYALQYWPKTVHLSIERDNDGEKKGFTAWDHDDEIDGPYFESGKSKHIVRHMLWAILCGRPKDIDGVFPVDQVVDKEKVKKKFGSSVGHDIENQDSDEQETIYFMKNLRMT